ncbi:MAG TPA: Vps62-related protein [Longimicrobium sp.]|nr:Vps62-related protein [Longimicrobium sp.]
MATTSMQFGELELAFTTDMKFRWSSEKSDAKYKGAFYHPVPPSGFYALGSVGVDYFGDDGNVAALCVRGTVGAAGSGAPLARPAGYERIWRNKGMNSKYGGACWRPIAPSGYVALGHVFGSDQDTAPSTSDIVCVRKDLAHVAYAGEFIYSDKNSDADHDFSAWRVAAPVYDGDQTGLLASLGFVGVGSHTVPTSDAALWVLNLPFPVETYASPEMPELTGYTDPGDYTEPVTDRIVYVPFTSVVDTEPVDSTGEKVTVGWQVSHTPFYTVRREANYHAIVHYWNTGKTQQTSPPKTTTVGVSEDTSKTYSVETGIEVGFEVGVDVGVEAQVSAKLSVLLGFSQTVSVGEFRESSVTFSIEVAPQTSGVLYAASYTLRLHRADGTEVGGGLTFDEPDSYLALQYPPAESAEESSVTITAIAAEPDEALA